MNALQNKLFGLQDITYREFHRKLIPTVVPGRIIGIRTPALRKFAKEFRGTPEAEKFLKVLPHRYYEENNLHAFLVESIADYSRAMAETERFLPYVDNWATCDMFAPKAFRKHPEETLRKVRAWLGSKEPYTVRFGLETLMRNFLDADFSPEFPKLVSGIRSGEYYVQMMCAWYMATALAKQRDATLPYFTGHGMSPEVHRMAVQKAIESFRIDDETKRTLRKLRGIRSSLQDNQSNE